MKKEFKSLSEKEQTIELFPRNIKQDKVLIKQVYSRKNIKEFIKREEVLILKMIRGEDIDFWKERRKLIGPKLITKS